MNKVKKILSVGIAALMICSTVTINSVAETSAAIISGLDGKTEHTVGSVTYTVIDSKEDLLAATAANTSYILAKDIDMGGAVYSASKAYALTLADGSVLDGNGCKINNFSITHGEAALISFAGNATVKNLQIGDAENLITTLRGVYWSAENTNVVFENCKVYAKANAEKTVGQQVAAFIGAASGNLTFRNCSSYGEIYSNNYHAAGIVGRTTASATFENCYNYANVENLGSGKYTAGIIATAQNSTDNSAKVKLENCVNYGRIESAGYNAGGIAACLSQTAELTVRNCVNFGEISATGERAGGIVGHIGATATVDGCVNYGNVRAPKIVGGINAITDSQVTYINCENNGAVTATGVLAGGILGDVAGANIYYTMTNCSNNGNVSGTDSVGGLLGGGHYTGTDPSSTTSYNSLIITGSRNGGAISGTTHVGGFVGFLHIGRDAAVDADKYLNITDSENYGSVTGTGARVSGFVGRYYDKHTGSKIQNCKNYGEIKGFNNVSGFVGESCHMTFEGCINYGDIIGTANNSDAAGICGWFNRPTTIKNCTNLGSVTGGQRVSQCVTGSTAALEISGFYAFGAMTNGTSSGMFTGQSGTFTGSGNKCISDPAAYVGQVGVATDSVVSTDAAKTLITARHGNMPLVADENGNLSVLGFALRAAQATKAVDGKQRIRFVASTKLDASEINGAGFEITVTDGNGTNKVDYACQTLSSGFNASVDGKKVSYSASCIGGACVFIGYVDDASAQGTVTYKVKPYVLDDENNKLYGTEYTVIYSDGVFVSATAVQ